MITLHALVEQVAVLLKVEIRSRHAALYNAVSGDLPPVRADRIHLQQVLVNPVLNSVDAMETLKQGSRRIEVSAVELEDGLVEMAVRDTEPGIDPDQSSDISELSVTSKPHGTGIGLSISKTIVEAHGGRIRAENNPGGGACIRFTLPVARPEAPV